MAQNKKNNKNKAPKWNNTAKETVQKEKEYEMFLMLVEKVDAKGLYDALLEKGLEGLDVWSQMGVFSIELRENDCVDFEELIVKESFVDNSDLAFIKNRKIESVFSFRATENQMERLKPYFKEMVEIFGGFVCSDSDDFQPMVEL